MELAERIVQLARITDAPSVVFSVYLNTRWADEHQRDRTRLFLKGELKRAREVHTGPGSAEDLAWIQAESDGLINQSRYPDARGVALFACHALRLREALPVRLPFEDAFVATERPFLRPLVALLERSPATLVVFVDGESARLIPVGPEGAGEEARLESEVPGHHRRGGWAQLAQSRYQRHILDHRGRHFEAVAAALEQLAEGNGVQHIVLAGEPRITASFGRHLPERLQGRVAGGVTAARYEPAAAIVARAAQVVDRLGHESAGAAADQVLTEAAKGGQAVAGLEETLDAVARGAAHRLYLLRPFREAGRVCPGCGALSPGAAPACRVCGKATRPTELGEAILNRVIAAGGTVAVLDEHAGLARVGGVAARLRYPL